MVCKRLSGAYLGELALLHALADVPVDERTLGVHEVELVVNARVEPERRREMERRVRHGALDA